MSDMNLSALIKYALNLDPLYELNRSVIAVIDLAITRYAESVPSSDSSLMDLYLGSKDLANRAFDCELPTGVYAGSCILHCIFSVIGLMPYPLDYELRYRLSTHS